MSASSSPHDESGHFLLRWSEDAFSPSREERVQMLETRISEAVICSSLRVVEKTEVFLIGKNCTESGVVRSCRPSGGKFIVTIVINPQVPEPPDFDPGVLLLDNFMTEEQEQRILDEIDNEIQRQQFRSFSSARSYLNTTCGEGTAALNRLVKFTLRSSTALVSTSVGQLWGKCRQVAGSGVLPPRAHMPTAAPRPATPSLSSCKSQVIVSVPVQ